LFIPTGSKALDAALGGGARGGFLTDVYGESGSGKSQLCFTLCANCARTGDRAMFVDTAGTFRPERISEIAGSSNALDRIAFVRALHTEDQIAALEKARGMNVQLLIIDTLTSLFSAEYAGPARHLAVMSHLHDLSLFAITSGCAVVVTNMIRNVPTEGKPVQREYLGSSVSIYSHAKVRLEIENAASGQFKAIMIQPPGKTALFSITALGVSDRPSV
jgi:RecA/RadA recombinase